MKETTSGYNIFFKLIEAYGPKVFSGIDPNDSLMTEAEEIMNQNDQFFYFGDLILFHILYTSKRSLDILGVEPADLSPLKFYKALHPDEMQRNILYKNVLTKTAHDFFLAEKGHKLLSTSFQVKNAKGNISMSYRSFSFITVRFPINQFLFLKSTPISIGIKKTNPPIITIWVRICQISDILTKNCYRLQTFFQNANLISFICLKRVIAQNI